MLFSCGVACCICMYMLCASVSMYTDVCLCRCMFRPKVSIDCFPNCSVPLYFFSEYFTDLGWISLNWGDWLPSFSPHNRPFFFPRTRVTRVCEHTLLLYVYAWVLDSCFHFEWQAFHQCNISPAFRQYYILFNLPSGELFCHIPALTSTWYLYRS